LRGRCLRFPVGVVLRLDEVPRKDCALRVHR
jgi:hypothetical protein